MNMTSLQDRLQASTERFLKIRRNIHAHPELGEDTLDTAALVTGLLEGWGYEVHTGVGGHGVVGVLRRGSGSRTWACGRTWMPCRSSSATACPGPANAPG